MLLCIDEYTRLMAKPSKGNPVMKIEISEKTES